MSFAETPGMHLQHLILDSKATATTDQKIACLKTLRIVVKNLADPQKNADPKYRQLKLSNEKVKAKITPCPSALDYITFRTLRHSIDLCQLLVDLLTSSEFDYYTSNFNR